MKDEYCLLCLLRVRCSVLCFTSTISLEALEGWYLVPLLFNTNFSRLLQVIIRLRRKVAIILASLSLGYREPGGETSKHADECPLWAGRNPGTGGSPRRGSSAQLQRRRVASGRESCLVEQGRWVESWRMLRSWSGRGTVRAKAWSQKRTLMRVGWQLGKRWMVDIPFSRDQETLREVNRESCRDRSEASVIAELRAVHLHPMCWGNATALIKVMPAEVDTNISNHEASSANTSLSEANSGWSCVSEASVNTRSDVVASYDERNTARFGREPREWVERAAFPFESCLSSLRSWP